MASACELCWEVAYGDLPVQYAHHLPRRRHASVGSAVVLPALAPLRVGHVLVIPQQHMTSAAALDPPCRGDLVAALDLLGERICSDDERLLAFEHGIRPGTDGGCGIAHAHVHAVPVTAAESEQILERAHQLLAGGRAWSGPLVLDALANDSYVYVGDWHAGTGFGTTGEFPSQTLRRLIAPALGSPRDDWRALGGWDDVRATDGIVTERLQPVAGGAVGCAG